MRKPSLVIALAGLALSAAAPQSAPPTGSNIPGARPTSPVQSVGGDPEWRDADVTAIDRTRQVTRKYAECVVKKRVGREQAQAVVLGDVRNERIVERYRSVVDPDCIMAIEKSAWGVRLGFPGDTLRYALADALVNSEIPQPIADFKSIPRLPRRQHNPADFEPKSDKKPLKSTLAQLAEARRLDLEEIFVDGFGECVARTDPIKAHRLLLADPASPAEDAAVKAIYPALASCISPGQKMKINATMVRGTVAVNYYRLANAARQSAPQAAKQ